MWKGCPRRDFWNHNLVTLSWGNLKSKPCLEVLTFQKIFERCSQNSGMPTGMLKFYEATFILFSVLRSPVSHIRKVHLFRAVIPRRPLPTSGELFRAHILKGLVPKKVWLDWSLFKIADRATNRAFGSRYFLSKVGCRSDQNTIFPFQLKLIHWFSEFAIFFRGNQTNFPHFPKIHRLDEVN